MEDKARPYWISWFGEEGQGQFELHMPWWISGYRLSDDAATICAALMARSPAEAAEQIYASYDVRPAVIEFRFCEEKDPAWAPFCDRFPRADWMVWEP